MSEAIKSIVNNITRIGDAPAKSLVADFVSSLLDAIFTSTSIGGQEQRGFFVTFEQVAVIRYDFYVYRYSISKRNVFSSAASVVAYTFARSVVDHTKVSEDELDDAVEQSMGGVAPPDQVRDYKLKLLELWKVQATKPLTTILSEVARLSQ